MASWLDVCPQAALEDPGARGFQAGAGDWPLQGLVVQRAGRLHAYENRCPHAGHALNWLPDRFLTRDGSQLLCASHGALFEPHSGLCIAGPCPGARLKALPVRVSAQGMVQVDIEGWRWE